MDNSDSDASNVETCPNEIEERIYKFNGDEIVKKYIKGKFLGKGGFAKCYELKCLNNKKTYAAKIVSKQNLSKNSAKQKLKSEIKIHKSLFHQNIVKFEHVFEDNHNVYILLELCKNKTLNELIKKRKILTEFEIKFYLDQILKAVKFMHKNKIIHRDLKLGNLFLSDNMELKIGDFGLATIIQYEGERKHTICGTPNYIAPEILDSKTSGHSFEVDYWAIGVIIYTLLFGKPPFETDDVKETYKRIQNINYAFPNHIYSSEEARDLIKNILVLNPMNRMNVDQIRKHDFIKNEVIPKQLPNYTINHPLNHHFYRKHKCETDPLKNVLEISQMETNCNDNLNNLKEFALNNLRHIKNEVVKDIFNTDVGVNEINKKLKINDSQRVVNVMDISNNKENHNLLKIKTGKVNMNKFTYVDQIFDYSESFGILYKTNNSLIGIVFNNKTNMYKFINDEEITIENKRNSNRKKYKLQEIKSKDDITKVDILINYEKYIKTIESNEIKNTNEIYVRKIIKTDISYILKFSNNIIQLIFSDNTKLIIDNYETKKVVFIDKNNKIYNYCIHLVNKCENKRFLKRYEHYKKVFYEKMEERFAKVVKKKEIVNNSENQHHSNRINHDLNKTT